MNSEKFGECPDGGPVVDPVIADASMMNLEIASECKVDCRELRNLWCSRCGSKNIGDCPITSPLVDPCIIGERIIGCPTADLKFFGECTLCCPPEDGPENQ